VPKIPGEFLEFKGELVHTALWDKSIELEGKRVAVVGTGASAIQAIPEVANVAKKLVVYQRLLFIGIKLIYKLQYKLLDYSSPGSPRGPFQNLTSASVPSFNFFFDVFLSFCSFISTYCSVLLNCSGTQ